MRARRALAWIGLGALGLAGVIAARRGLGLASDPASIQELVANLGVWGPLAYVGIVAFRIPLGLPSALVLMAGAVLFNTVTATICGAMGLTLSAVAIFLAARHSGRARVEARVPARLRPLLDLAGSRLGALFVALGTAYPFGPITMVHVFAGVTGMGLLAFVLSVAGGSLGRSALYTFFGRRLIEGDARGMLEAGVVFALVLALPLVFPGPRRWVRDAIRTARGGAPPTPEGGS